jgi:hypothetical protein
MERAATGAGTEGLALKVQGSAGALQECIVRRSGMHVQRTSFRMCICTRSAVIARVTMYIHDSVCWGIVVTPVLLARLQVEFCGSGGVVTVYSYLHKCPSVLYGFAFSAVSAFAFCAVTPCYRLTR